MIICGLLFKSSVIFKNNSATVSTKASSVCDYLTVIIDPGHGGFDGGTSTKDGFPEKNINLNISLFVEEYLKLLGIPAILTRTDDSSIEDNGLTTIRERKVSDIHNRMHIMESTKNSIFVSIHQNYYHETQYCGAQVFYSPEAQEQSSQLAQLIQESIIFNLQPDNTRLVKECNSSVYLIYNAVKPAVLVECGFLSNDIEAELLQTEQYQKEIALCITLGIIDYLR